MVKLKLVGDIHSNGACGVKRIAVPVSVSCVSQSVFNEQMSLIIKK